MEILHKENYLISIRNAVDSKLFKNLYAKINGERKDIVNNGELSCAYFVSSILYLFKLIKEVHATVNGTIKDLKDFGWVETEEPKEGAVLVWAEADFDGKGLHRHVGFYIGNKKAISNDDKSGTPQEHDWEFNGKRKIEMILWNQILENESLQ